MLLGELARRLVEAPDPLCSREIGNVHNQWVEAWSSLGFVDPSDRFAFGRIGGKPVDGLGRYRDRLTGEDQPRRLADALVVEGEDPRLHADAARGLGSPRKVQALSRCNSSSGWMPRLRIRERICGHSSLRKRDRSESL